MKQRKGGGENIVRPVITHSGPAQRGDQLPTMGMGHQLRRARGAASMKVSGNVIVLTRLAKNQMIVWLGSQSGMKIDHARLLW